MFQRPTFVPTHGYCAGVSRRSATGNCELRTCARSLRGGYRAGVEPTTLRLKAIDSTNAPPRLTIFIVNQQKFRMSQLFSISILSDSWFWGAGEIAQALITMESKNQLVISMAPIHSGRLRVSCNLYTSYAFKTQARSQDLRTTRALSIRSRAILLLPSCQQVDTIGSN